MLRRAPCRNSSRLACRAEQQISSNKLSRRALAALPISLAAGWAARADTAAAPEVTHEVYLDVGVCDTQVVCTDAASLGRVTLGLYGSTVPVTVANFVAAVEEGALAGTLFTSVLPGQYIQAGKQGLRRTGNVERPASLQSNSEVYQAGAFRLGHLRPGTLSLALADSDEEPVTKRGRGYVPLTFLITTGPGPALQLDGGNIVFGRVLGGMEVVRAVAQLPTFESTQNYMGVMSALNQAGSLLGDQRADRARRQWRRPVNAAIIQACGVLRGPAS